MPGRVLLLLAILLVTSSALGHGVNDADRDLILDQHNKMRSRVAVGNETRGNPGPQPSAANMMQLEWDDELSSTAQQFADYYANHHCEIYSREGPIAFPGQNIFQAYAIGINWYLAIELWYDEVRKFSHNSIDPFQSSTNYTNYAQLVWATTSKVGCGLGISRRTPCRFYVCSYLPAGAISNETMYLIGSPASKCPPRRNPSFITLSYEGLCAPLNQAQTEVYPL